jgi:hypothetical protein
MSFGKNDITGAVSGFSSILVWDAQGRLKVIGGGTPPPPAPVVWGSITGIVTNQTDLINYLGLNYYPLSSNPAGYLTQTAADALYYPLSSNPAGYITAAALAGYVPTTRTLTINGTSYDLSADRSWTIPAGGTVTSVGLTVPSAFSVTPGSITVSGTFVITGAGTVSQYIDGTGALQTFPTIPTVTPSALTKTDDTNVTLTLGGTPATALLQSVSLTLGWTGILATGRGGTGLSSIGTALQYLRVNSGGTGLEYATFPTIPTVTPSALTKTDDTNVTLTLGGTPATALLEATSLTLGWTGELSTSRGGTGLSTIGTSLQYLRVNLGGTALEYATFPTINSYTVDNGLTENPTGNFQLGGTLIQDTNIDGVGSGTWALNFTNLYSSTNTARYSYSFATTHASNNTLLSLDSFSNVSRFSHEDSTSGDVSAIELRGTELRVQTPAYATATNGDVLTLLDNTTGAAEWQTISGTTPGFQDVLINDSTLTQNNTVAGANFNFIWNAFNQYTINTDEYVLLNSTSGSKIASVSVNTLGVAPYVNINTKNGSDITGFYVDTTQLWIRTPGVNAATVSNGYVLTLTDVASGKVEFQTAPTGGNSLSPLLLMGG